MYFVCLAEINKYFLEKDVLLMTTHDATDQYKPFSFHGAVTIVPVISALIPVTS